MSGRNFEDLDDFLLGLNVSANLSPKLIDTAPCAPPLGHVYAYPPLSVNDSTPHHEAHVSMKSWPYSEPNRDNHLTTIESLMLKINKLEEEVKSKSAKIAMLESQLKSSSPTPNLSMDSSNAHTQEESSMKIFRILFPTISRLLLKDVKISSKPFLLGGIHWRVSLSQGEKNSISCSMEICEPNGLAESALYFASFTASLISAKSEIHRSVNLFKPFTPETYAWTWKNFISIEKLFTKKNEYIQHNSLLMKVEALLYKE